MRPARDPSLVLERLAAGLVAAVALALFLNGSLLSTWGAAHVDLSINLTAAHALRDGDDPYGTTALLDRAEALGSPTELIYSQLFTSYIQPPTSALSLLPLTTLAWRDATHVYLVLNHVFLFAAVGLTLNTFRPALPLRWLVAGAAVVGAAYAQVNASFALGQVDAIILLLLAVGLWGHLRGNAPLTGAAIAFAAAIKLIPGLLLLYFLWRREHRVVIWGAGVGLALFLVSLAYAGAGVYESYLTETLPALSKGSTHYSNASLGALIARAHTPEVVRGPSTGAGRGLPEMLYLDEVSGSGWARLASVAVVVGALAGLALVIPHRQVSRQGAGRSPLPPGEGGGEGAGPPPRTAGLILEYYLVVAVGLAISSVTWEFYVIWLLPVFLAVFLAPERFLPAGPWRWGVLVSFALLLVALNYPADCGSSRDCYLYEPNGLFYHPGWVPAVRVERALGLYATHLDAVLFLRLPALLLLTAGLASLARWSRKQPQRESAELRVQRTQT